MNRFTAILSLAREALRSPRPIDPVRTPAKHWQPSLWASWLPLRQIENFREIFRALHENRDNLDYAWRILNHGVCDGCSLGTTGMHDWTMENIHVCNVRLRLLRLNTLPALDIERLKDAGAMAKLGGKKMRALGRLPYPMLRRRGEAGFQRISWDQALGIVAEKIRATTPDRTYFYMTSRGEPNENYYAFQKMARAIGTNNVDNAARICHSPSTFGLKATLGVAATTCSYKDLIGTDLVVFVGSNVANNQPMMSKYLFYARKAGTKVAVINPFREPAMELNWVPSDLESALFGTRLTDRFFQVRPGGDVAFFTGALRKLADLGLMNESFVREHTADYDKVITAARAISWAELERSSGVSEAEMEAFARMVGKAERAVFVWGMGITQHACGEDNVYSIVNLALARGFVGREGCGLMPVRGHSGVQGGAEMGAYATAFPGGLAVNEDNARKLSGQWGFPVPGKVGLTTAEMIEVSDRGGTDVLFATGGDFHEVLPDPDRVLSAFSHIGLRVHFDIVPSSQMFIEPGKDAVLLLPAATRYEMPGGVTETTTERRIIFSPEIPGPRIGEARPEWEVYMELARRIRPEWQEHLAFADTAAIRAEIAQVVPMYAGIEKLAQEGDNVQYGGRMLCAGWKFPTADGKAHFHPTTFVPMQLPEDSFQVVQRRGKQFNSNVHEERDPATGLPRDAVIISSTDCGRLGLHDGDAVVLENEYGRFNGRVFTADVRPGSLEMYWPEGNVLVSGNARSPLAKIPAYRDVIAQLRRPRPDESKKPVSHAA